MPAVVSCKVYDMPDLVNYKMNGLYGIASCNVYDMRGIAICKYTCHA